MIFIDKAAHQISRFQVLVTTRSHEKGRQIVESLGVRRDSVQYEVVEDITQDGAFDVVRANQYSVYIKSQPLTQARGTLGVEE